jgi:hypothetical protein
MTLAAAPRPSSAQPSFPLALVAAAILAGLVAVFASLSLYLLEDNNPLTTPAYAASSLLRYSYDIAYVSALLVGVLLAGVFLTLLRLGPRTVVVATLVLALLVAFAGFGGLLTRQPVAFGALFAVYTCLLLLSLFVGYGVVATRAAVRPSILGATVGACVAVIMGILVNAAAVVIHTLALNPVSQALFLQGQIGDTRLSALRIGMGLEALSLLVCLAVLLLTWRRA